MRLKSVFLSARPIVPSLARSTMPSSTTLFSNNRKVQRGAAFGRLGTSQGNQLGLLLAVKNPTNEDLPDEMKVEIAQGVNMTDRTRIMSRRV
jgi:hypothetical protein